MGLITLFIYLNIHLHKITQHVQVAARCKVWVYGRSFVIAGSNLARDTDVSLL
jgi:hypothetical protein